MYALCALLAIVALSSTASAHNCAAYDGCDAGACKEGEDHYHQDFNYWERDEHCESWEEEEEKDDDDDTPPDDACYIADKKFPPAICEVSSDAVARGKAIVAQPSSVVSETRGLVTDVQRYGR